MSFKLNPDIRGADEIIPRKNLTGWTDGKIDLKDALRIEREGEETILREMPSSAVFTDSIALLPEMAAKWEAYQKSKGRFPGSFDWTLLDEFVTGAALLWLPQIIGSCVVSNSIRGWALRNMYQVVMLGLSQEYLGRNEFGSVNYSPYGPFSYGLARMGTGIRGDGLFCEAMVKAYLRGVLSCSNPKLLEILKKLGVDRTKDFPEPQSESVYRSFGNGSYINELLPYMDYSLQECPYIKTEEQLDKALRDCKPVFHCSGLAIKKIGEHKDGFAIHGRDPNDSWAHNMCYHGYMIASDGAKFYRMSNESWGEKHVYNLPVSQVVDFYKNRNVTSAAIGMINAPTSAPPRIEL